MELHTGEYANAQTQLENDKHLTALKKGAVFGLQHGLGIHAGHGLTYKNIAQVVNIHEITEFYIGHSILARSIYAGLDRAVRDMLALINN